MPVINKKSGVKAWAKKPGPSKPVAWSDEDAQEFYNGMPWRNLRKAYSDRHPLCEVAREQKKFIPAAEIDHIIPVRFGGAKLDERNLMALSKYNHRRKTGKEVSKGAPLVAWIETDHGLIPKEREQIIRVLLHGAAQ